MDPLIFSVCSRLWQFTESRILNSFQLSAAQIASTLRDLSIKRIILYSCFSRKTEKAPDKSRFFGNFSSGRTDRPTVGTRVVPGRRIGNLHLGAPKLGFGTFFHFFTSRIAQECWKWCLLMFLAFSRIFIRENIIFSWKFHEFSVKNHKIHEIRYFRLLVYNSLNRESNSKSENFRKSSKLAKSPHTLQLFVTNFLWKVFGFFPMIYKIHVVARKRDSAPPFAAIRPWGTDVRGFGNCEGLLHGAFIWWTRCGMRMHSTVLWKSESRAMAFDKKQELPKWTLFSSSNILAPFDEILHKIGFEHRKWFTFYR